MYAKQPRNNGSNVISFNLQPQSIECEELVLGAILFDNRAMSLVIDALIPEMFYVSAHGTIYGAMVEMFAIGKPIDCTTLDVYLSDRALSEKAGGREKIFQLVERCIGSVNVAEYAAVVRDKYLRRQAIRVGSEISQLGYETETELEDTFNAIEQKVFSLTQNNKVRGDTGASSNAAIARDALLDLDRDAAIYPTGFHDLDALIGGLESGTLTVAAGRPGMGKSQVGLSIAHHFAARHQLPVVFFSLEMSKKQLEYRLWSLITGHELHAHHGFSKLGSDRIRLHRSGQQPLQEWERAMLGNISAIASGLPLYISDNRQPSLGYIASEIRQAISKVGKVGLVVVDYLQRVAGSDDGEDNRSYELGRFINGLYDLASPNQLDVPILALSQVSRVVESRNNHRPQMSDLAQSGIIETTADTIIGLYRDEYYNPETSDKGVLEAIVLKNRHGATGTAKLIFDPSCGAIRNTYDPNRQSSYQRPPARPPQQTRNDSATTDRNEKQKSAIDRLYGNYSH